MAATSIRFTRSPFMKIGFAFAIVRSITANAVTTLMPPGRVTLALAVDAPSVPASPLLCTVVRPSRGGVRTTWTIVPSGMLAPSKATVTGFGSEAGTMTSGTDWSEPAGDAGALTPATEAMRRLGEFGGVIGCGNERLATLVRVVDPVRALRSYASRRT